MEKSSAAMCIHMITWITIVKPLVWTMAFVPGYGLRAAGDVKFSMITFYAVPCGRAGSVSLHIPHKSLRLRPNGSMDRNVRRLDSTSSIHVEIPQPAVAEAQGNLRNYR